MRRILLISLLMPMLLAPVQVRASMESLHLRFAAMWGGFHAADFTLSITPQGAAYRNAFHMETRGIFRWLTRMWIRARSEGVVDGDARLEARSYRVDYRIRKRERTITVAYDQAGGAAVPRIETKGDTRARDAEREEEVPPDLRDDVTDPVSAVVEAMVRARDHVENGGPATFTLNVYDGQQRFDVDAEVLDQTTRTVLGKTHRVYPVRLAPRPLAGFDERRKVLWGAVEYTLYLSADGRYVPVQIASTGIGPMLNLMAECDTAAACAIEPGED
jgi:hypothetical protein